VARLRRLCDSGRRPAAPRSAGVEVGGAGEVEPWAAAMVGAGLCRPRRSCRRDRVGGGARLGGQVRTGARLLVAGLGESQRVSTVRGRRGKR
jgi:hypothetical protein